MSVARFFVLLVLGCGRVNFDRVDTVSDAQRGSGPFGPVLPLTDLNSAVADDDPTLRGDGLELIFDSEQGGTGAGDLYVTKRTSRTAPWSLPVPIAELATPTEDEDGPCLSSDGRVLTFASTRAPGPSESNLWVTTRMNPDSPWSPPTQIAELNTNDIEDRFCIVSSRLLGFFASSRDGASMEIYVATRTTEDALWLPATKVNELSWVGFDADPAIDASGTMLTFTSNREGSAGGLDLWVATRSSLADPFSTPEPLVEINTVEDEQDATLSDDLRTLVFVRGGDADRDMFFAER